ncbi:MAG TPA: hypothetical protein VJN69_02705 [Candidatus Acidoferrales bacterium]|nr:hypothetical protein [Candidatus Acidoferrales bacterium]
MGNQWRIVVATSDNDTWKGLSQTLEGFGLERSWAPTVESCAHIFRRDLVNLVFCDERVSDGDYWDIYGAITRGLTKKPQIVLMAKALDIAECEHAKACGVFAVIESPFQPASVEWTILLAKRAEREPPKAAPAETVPKFDIFIGAPDRDALWVCTVRGLANAKERMDQIAAERPGRYFIFYTPERKVLSQIETFAKPALVPQPKSSQRAG